ncbi:MAG: DNA polymerase III subunit chi [Alphaproteobacteria bacterium]|nr:MAG: DNA polymerase III subunit chi [Alphaproteobacteria bacterium]
MGEIFFYHLTRSPLEEALPMLLERALGAGWRVAVRGREEARLAWLDEQLWLRGGEESFLPHGLAGGAHDARQPILLTAARAPATEAPNRPACLVSVDGAEVTAQEVALLERAMILFDGNDAQALERARGQWRALTAAGVRAKYWSQQSGRWEMKAQSGENGGKT